MRLPGFTAEAALCAAGERHNLVAVWPAGASEAAIESILPGAVPAWLLARLTAVRAVVAGSGAASMRSALVLADRIWNQRQARRGAATSSTGSTGIGESR
jgi:hypothetical protein